MDLSIMKPIFIQVGLTFFLLFWMATERWAALSAGQIVRGDPGVRPTWPGRAGIVSNAFHNQLEVPMLFYVVVLFSLITNAVDVWMVGLAWAYVVLRLIHTAIHVTYNKIRHRFTAYALSNIVLIAMWMKLAIHVLSRGAV